MNNQSIFSNYTILIVLILTATSSVAQKKGYQEGYIITPEGDTTKGWVQDRDPGVFSELYSRIRFIEKDKKKHKKYSASQIQGYGYGSSVFESVPMKAEMQLLVTGYYLNENYSKIFLKLIERNKYLTHYEQEFVYEQGESIDSYPLFLKTGAFSMVRVTQGMLGLKKQRLMEYFKDCPALVTAIEKLEVTTVNEVYEFYSDNCSTK